AGGLVGALADQQRPQELDAGRDKGLTGHGAADAGEPLVGEYLDDGVEVLFGPVALRPAAVRGAAGEAGETDVGDFHRKPPRRQWPSCELQTGDIVSTRPSFGFFRWRDSHATWLVPTCAGWEYGWRAGGTGCRQRSPRRLHPPLQRQGPDRLESGRRQDGG